MYPGMIWEVSKARLNHFSFILETFDTHSVTTILSLWKITIKLTVKKMFFSVLHGITKYRNVCEVKVNDEAIFELQTLF